MPNLFKADMEVAECCFSSNMNIMVFFFLLLFPPALQQNYRNWIKTLKPRNKNSRSSFSKAKTKHRALKSEHETHSAAPVNQWKHDTAFKTLWAHASSWILHNKVILRHCAHIIKLWHQKILRISSNQSHTGAGILSPGPHGRGRKLEENPSLCVPIAELTTALSTTVFRSALCTVAMNICSQQIIDKVVVREVCSLRN